MSWLHTNPSCILWLSTKDLNSSRVLQLAIFRCSYGVVMKNLVNDLAWRTCKRTFFSTKPWNLSTRSLLACAFAARTFIIPRTWPILLPFQLPSPRDLTAISQAIVSYASFNPFFYPVFLVLLAFPLLLSLFSPKWARIHVVHGTAHILMSVWKRHWYTVFLPHKYGTNPAHLVLKTRFEVRIPVNAGEKVELEECQEDLGYSVPDRGTRMCKETSLHCFERGAGARPPLRGMSFVEDTCGAPPLPSLIAHCTSMMIHGYKFRIHVRDHVHNLEVRVRVSGSATFGPQHYCSITLPKVPPRNAHFSLLAHTVAGINVIHWCATRTSLIYLYMEILYQMIV